MTRETDLDRRLADWIAEGPLDAPDAPVRAAVAHARAHPRRRLSARDLWKTIMSQVHLSEAHPSQPAHRGVLTAAVGVVAVAVIAVALYGAGVLRPTQPPTGQPAAAATAPPTAETSPSPTTMPSPTPTARSTASPAPSPSLWAVGKAAAVTGTIDCGTVITPGKEDASTSPYSLSDQVLGCAATASDPRVAGPGTLHLNVTGWDPALPTYGENGLAWGYEVITGPDGTWAGRCHGLYDKDGVLHNYCIFAGNDAYDGLIYVVYGTVPASSATASIVGLIQPGTVPPGYPVEPLPAP